MSRPKTRCLALALALLFLSFAPPQAGTEPEIPPRLEGAMRRLESVPEGELLSAFIRRGGIRLHFGPCRIEIENTQASACFDHRSRTISVSPDLEEAPLDFLAALIAHEATHAERSVQTQIGYLFRPAPEARLQLMLAEEAAAYRVQVRVWRALRQRAGAPAEPSPPDLRTLAMEHLARRVEKQTTEEELVRLIARDMGYSAYYGGGKPAGELAGSK